MEICQHFQEKNKLSVKLHTPISLHAAKPLSKSSTPSDKIIGNIRNTKGIPKYKTDNTQQAYSQHQIKWRES